MSQYTDKINRIAKDFAEIEHYEGTTSLLAQTGCVIITYRHGGYLITAGEQGGEYNGYELGPKEELYVESNDEYYLKLKSQYSAVGPTLNERLAKVWKRIFNVKRFDLFK